MQLWDTLANVIGDLIVLAAAVTDLAAARAKTGRNRRRRRGTPPQKR